MKTVDHVGAQLRFEHAPRPGAPALLLINSLGASLEMWDDQTESLGERYELIRYDARGHGQSTASTHREYTMAALTGDAIAVLDACGVARAHVCGLSLGGMTAMTLALRAPDRVLKLALCNTSAHMPPKDAWQTRIETVLKDGMAAVIEGTLERWFTPAFRQAEPAKVDRVRAMLANADPRAYAACGAAIRDMDLREAIGAIAAKTLVIAGTVDPATPPAHAQLIAGRIPDARLVTLDCAHLSNIERAKEFNATLMAFLAVEAMDAP